jgi:catechol 2,3-dioxygenase-like lactoylglutathione lyase family enzyme
MTQLIEKLLTDYESGKVSRRGLIQALAGLTAATAHAAPETVPFKAVSLNHITLSVNDVEKSRAFYQGLFGLETLQARPGVIAYLGVGNNSFICIEKLEQRGFDHVCFGVNGYNVDAAAKQLEARGVPAQVDRRLGEIFFRDPDGVKLQIGAADLRPR